MPREEQMILIDAGVTLQLSRAELVLLGEALRPLIEQAAATGDECVAMGLHEMADAAAARLRDVERLASRLTAALQQFEEDPE